MSANQLVQVAIVATPEVDASALAGLHGVLSSFADMSGTAVAFEPKVVMPDGLEGQCQTGQKLLHTRMGMVLPINCRLRELPATDVIVIPSLFLLDHRWIPNPYPDLTAWLKQQHDRGALICSACTGAFLLAETGLLDEQTVTLHWAFESLFHTSFPRPKIDIDKALIQTGESGRIIMSGASAAWHDLVIYLMSRFAGAAVAKRMAKYFLLSIHASGQRPYRLFQPSAEHDDSLVAAAQSWLGEHCTAANAVAKVVAQSGLQTRTFHRRFKRATGLSPIRYVQLLRIELARQLLESGTQSIEEISWQVGYEDPAFFRKLFGRITGLKPSTYRRRFGGDLIGY